ncbi:MAG: hypothetical protein OIN85_01845 [Candidatus Methanoperedens sp.]|nr:hypothetical protein [Candidatus Methanoperedens sp.]
MFSFTTPPKVTVALLTGTPAVVTVKVTLVSVFTVRMDGFADMFNKPGVGGGVAVGVGVSVEVDVGIAVGVSVEFGVTVCPKAITDPASNPINNKQQVITRVFLMLTIFKRIPSPSE